MSAELAWRYPAVLTIAGSDSGGGAGIQADLKTFAALGCFGTSAITALTAQNTLGVRAIHAVPAEFLAAQIDAVVEDIPPLAVKIGMLHSAEVVAAVATAIDRHRLAPVILDPVMVSTSGSRLIDADAVEALVRLLFPRVALVTPNLDEAAWLAGMEISGVDAMEAAARRLLDLGAPAVLLKGGHLPGDEVVDLLLAADGTQRRLRAPRVRTGNLHGTGCTLSSAIAARMALGHGLSEAVGLAADYVQRALQAGADVRTGAGSGPLNHGFNPQAMRLLPRIAR